MNEDFEKFVAVIVFLALATCAVIIIMTLTK